MRVNELLNEAFSLNPMTAEKAEKEFGKGTWKRVVFKQEGGNDGYQYVVRVDGRPVMSGLTRREAEAEKLTQVNKIAKAQKLGKYAAVNESEHPHYWTDKKTGHEWMTTDEYHVNLTTGEEFDLGWRPVWDVKPGKSRYYFDVPFSKKEEAKKEGMRWDPAKKKWYHSSEFASSKSRFKALKEDWGSSDWYPVLQSMAEELLHGSSMRDAAYNAGAFYKEHMGYPPTAGGDEDMIDAVMTRWERLPEDRKKFFMDQAKESHEKLKSFQKKPVTEAWTVVVRNKDGVGKRFPSRKVDSPEADIWRNSSNKKDDKIGKKDLDRDFYFRVISAVSSSFPDGDPLDHIQPFMRRNGLDIDDVNRVMKKFEKVSYDTYLANMWDDYASDAVADAKMELKSGRLPQQSSFYKIENTDGQSVTGKEKIVKNSNPWK